MSNRLKFIVHLLVLVFHKVIKLTTVSKSQCRKQGQVYKNVGYDSYLFCMILKYGYILCTCACTCTYFCAWGFCNNMALKNVNI